MKPNVFPSKTNRSFTYKQDSSDDEEAIKIFNSIKDEYSIFIDDLNALKKEMFKSEAVDQQQKSKIRITIESILIDLNEEIFNISEELAKSYTFDRNKNLMQKAKEFENRKNSL